MQPGLPVIARGVFLNAETNKNDNIQLSDFEVNAIQNQQLNLAQISA